MGGLYGLSGKAGLGVVESPGPCFPPPVELEPLSAVWPVPSLPPDEAIAVLGSREPGEPGTGATVNPHDPGGPTGHGVGDTTKLGADPDVPPPPTVCKSSGWVRQ